MGAESGRREFTRALTAWVTSAEPATNGEHATAAPTVRADIGTVAKVGKLVHHGGLAVIIAATITACSANSGQDTTSARLDETNTIPAANDSAASAVEDYPDSITRTLDRLASAPRPVEPSAIPPRQLDEETFPISLVDRERIVFGGVPPDGIPPIDDPRYESVQDVDWLNPDEAVLVAEIDGHARAYPVQIMIWHEIVNDVLGDRPLAVTYCPLCNSGVAFDRRLGDDVLDFGTSGALYQANLVMYDRQTESLWTQFDGRSVVGTRVGDQLDRVPVATVAWREFRDQHPDGTVLARSLTNPKPYGRNPYNAYDQRTTAIPGFFTGEPDGSLAPYERIVGLERNGDAVAVPHRALAEAGTAAVAVDGTDVSVWHLPGMASPLNDSDVAGGDDIGSTRAYHAEVRGRATEFRRRGDQFIDAATGSTWNFLGEAVDGPMQGERLRPVVHVDTFWFAWATFHLDTQLVEPTT